MVLVILFLITLPIVGIADFNESERATLEGIKGIYVVEKISPEAEKDGLTGDLVRTDVELQLRKSGIRVLTKKEWLEAPGRPYLYVRVFALKYEEMPLYSVDITVAINQLVRLNRDLTVSSVAVTWSNEVNGIVEDKKMKASVREQLKNLVDKFINDYLAVNPK